MQKEVAKSYNEVQFDRQEWAKGEREKTEVEEQIISLADEVTSRVLIRFGLNPLTVPLKNIHLIRSGEWKMKAGGVTMLLEQSIYLHETDTLLQFAHVVVHEMLHMKSHGAIEIKPTGATDPGAVRLRYKINEEDPFEVSLVEYRSGMNVKSRPDGRKHFEAFTEAITERLTKTILQELRDREIFQVEQEQTDALVTTESKNRPKIPADEFVVLREEAGVVKGETFVYQKERSVLETLMKKIMEQNPDRFFTIEEVFDLFVKNFITGQMLELGRVIEKTFGAGTYRKLGAYNEDVKGLKVFVDAL